MLAIAKLGGHLKRNGDPGWITLGRGYERLLILEEGWKLAKWRNLLRDTINHETGIGSQQ
jgi:hypothetical protein